MRRLLGKTTVGSSAVCLVREANFRGCFETREQIQGPSRFRARDAETTVGTVRAQDALARFVVYMAARAAIAATIAVPTTNQIAANAIAAFRDVLPTTR